MDTKKKPVKKAPQKKDVRPLVSDGPIIFRVDDVVNFSNVKYLENIRRLLVSRFGGTEGENIRFMPAISLFGQRNMKGSVYPDTPFKDKPLSYFWNVDSFFQRLRWPGATIASHGLFHVDHTKLSPDALEMSIVGSCRYLRTRIFVPPFNRENEAVEKVCQDNGIHLVSYSEGWRSLEHETFDPAHKLWYFHHWKYPRLDDFAKVLRLEEKKSEDEKPEDKRDTAEWWEKGSNPEYEMSPEQNLRSQDPKVTQQIQQEVATSQHRRK